MSFVAFDVRELPTSVSQNSSVRAADAVVLRIGKMLDLALHVDTPRAEAERAMCMARREMNRHNLEQLRVTERAAELRQQENFAGGAYAVSLRNERTLSIVFSKYAWLRVLISACCRGFDVNYYFDIQKSLPLVVFYGLRSSAELAARSFARYFEHMEQLTQAYQSITFIYQYRLGLAEGLDIAFLREIKRERIRIETFEAEVEKGRCEQQAVRRRLDECIVADMMTQLAAGCVNVTQMTPFVIDVDGEHLSIETVVEEIAACRALSVCIEEVQARTLEMLKVKIRTSQRLSVKRDSRAYKDGLRDSKCIRLHQEA